MQSTVAGLPFTMRNARDCSGPWRGLDEPAYAGPYRRPRDRSNMALWSVPKPPNLPDLPEWSSPHVAAQPRLKRAWSGMITPWLGATCTTPFFGRLLAFLNRLEGVNASYRLGHTRADSVMVEIALPGWRWEIEFVADGAVEIERYQSVAGVEDQPDLLEELFTDLEGS
jgi:hypothetical protein